MRIAFRTDASIQIGTGHFMRCLALAEELKKKGANILFISRNPPPHLVAILNSKGMECKSLIIFGEKEPVEELFHSNWLETSQAEDAKVTIKVLANHLWDWIIVDHYALDKRWENVVRPNCRKLMVIDDLADRQHYCDVLLDQNYFANMQTRYINNVPKDCQLLIGPGYSLLREEFRALRAKVIPRTGEVKKILVFFGGVDSQNYTSIAIQALVDLNITLAVDVVIGSQHPNRNQLQKACNTYGFVLHEQTTQMAKLMAEADLAIGAGGSASWERCCLGLPGLIVAVAANQIAIAKALDSIGACYYLGDKNSVSSSSIKNAIHELLVAPYKLVSISNRSLLLVDGLGINRVLDALSI